MKNLAQLLITLLLSGCHSSKVSEITVIGIKDGDTIELIDERNQTQTIRLLDIDCPEKGQPFEKAAKQFCADLCFGKQVKIVRKTKDRYGRILGTVYVDNKLCVNKALVQAGLAWHFKKYPQKEEYAVLENEARGKKVGLWQDAAPIAPWDWRKSRNR